MLSGLRTLLILGRVSNLPTVWTNVAVGWFISGGDWRPELAWILGGVSLLYIAGMTLNDAFDAKWDSEHATDRPIPSGRIAAGAVWFTGIIEMGAGIAVLLLFTSFHLYLLIGLLAAILLYNWIHKRWAGSVLVMGICRALVYAGAGSAVAVHTNTIELPLLLWIIAGISVIYIAGLTLAARSEHLKEAKGPGLLPRLMLMLPVILPLLGSRIMPEGLINVALTVLGVIGIWAWVTITRAWLRKRIPVGVAYAIAGIAFYDAAILAFADWRAAVAALGCFVLTLGAQRVIPAT
jgi:4-hydroxybenzoate polyprenyltransferase